MQLEASWFPQFTGGKSGGEGGGEGGGGEGGGGEGEGGEGGGDAVQLHCESHADISAEQYVARPLTVPKL